MRIESIAVAIPSLKITNDQLLDLIKRFSADIPATTVKQYQIVVGRLLEQAGAQTRFVRDRSQGENAIDLVKSAMGDALHDANLQKKEIDLLIYCGVGRGFLEPANAYFFASALGLNCQCFDVVDACMSWVRALELAYLFLERGCYKVIAIVNAELNFYERGYPEVFQAKSLDRLEYTFPAYTVGEAASVTLVSASEGAWSFDYDSAPELVDVCAIPLEGYEGFAIDLPNGCLNGVGKFYACGGKMFAVAKSRIVQLVNQKVSNIEKADLWFPHAASAQIVREIGDSLCIEPPKLYNRVFPEFGNIVSASLPTAMKMAGQEKVLERGQAIVLCAASAGMSFAVAQAVF